MSADPISASVLSSHTSQNLSSTPFTPATPRSRLSTISPFTDRTFPFDSLGLSPGSARSCWRLEETSIFNPQLLNQEVALLTAWSKKPARHSSSPDGREVRIQLCHGTCENHPSSARSSCAARRAPRGVDNRGPTHRPRPARRRLSFGLSHLSWSKECCNKLGELQFFPMVDRGKIGLVGIPQIAAANSFLLSEGLLTLTRRALRVRASSIFSFAPTHALRGRNAEG